ncbi:MAG TPA: M28 family peptidase [Chitinophagaceae bacterium]|nr:M28 family peptidase [Chitinophagaceae bacterium]
MYKYLFVLLVFLSVSGYSQLSTDQQLAKIKLAGYQQSQVKKMFHQLTDVYGQRLTGSREYYAAAKWTAATMKEIGLTNVHFENYCKDCRGWSMKSFNVEMVAPNFMHIVAYPLAWTKSTNGTVEGELIHIENWRTLDSVKKNFSGKLKGKIVLLGKEPRQVNLTDTVFARLSENQLKKMETQLVPEEKTTPLPDMLDRWAGENVEDQPFLEFVEKEGALAILRTSPKMTGILNVSGTYYYKESNIKPLPYFSIMPEHFGRMLRLLKQDLPPKVRLNLETSFYLEPDNNVNIIGEIEGSDPALKSELILIGGHFDSWHLASGATDNGVSCVVLMEALRILKQSGLKPKRSIRIGLWGGEEQDFVGSVSYAREHFGELKSKPNAESEKVSAYLNLDNGGGAIRGIYLQGNEMAGPVFNGIFGKAPSLAANTLTIENTTSTDHETFDYYNIPSFQFIQDPLSYETVNHHTHLDFPEYVPEEDMMKNAVILAWTIYNLADMETKVPRKSKK